jgi:hypothetical protein
MFMSANTSMNHLLTRLALWQAQSREQQRSDVHEANTHEPSADMTGAVASAEQREQLSDVHECKHSMNHLLT